MLKKNKINYDLFLNYNYYPWVDGIIIQHEWCVLFLLLCCASSRESARHLKKRQNLDMQVLCFYHWWILRGGGWVQSLASSFVWLRFTSSSVIGVAVRCDHPVAVPIHVSIHSTKLQMKHYLKCFPFNLCKLTICKNHRSINSTLRY